MQMNSSPHVNIFSVSASDGLLHNGLLAGIPFNEEFKQKIKTVFLQLILFECEMNQQ